MSKRMKLYFLAILPPVGHNVLFKVIFIVKTTVFQANFQCVIRHDMIDY